MFSRLTLLLWLAPAASSAFTSVFPVTTTSTNRRRQSLRPTIHHQHAFAAPSTYSSSSSSLFVKRFDSLEDYEQARSQFENLWTKQTRKQVVNPVQMRQYYELLRQRHQQEVRLLKSLEHSDTAVKDLIQLWSTTIAPPPGYSKASFDPNNNRSSSNADSSSASSSATPNTLIQLQPSVLHASSTTEIQDDEAQALHKLAEEHPDWAEPCLRLAAYYWRQNQALPAYEWALKGLEIQPYHFVSSTMFMLLSIQQGHQAEEEYWSSMRLPKTFGMKRSQWVQRAVYECQDKFQQQSDEIQQILHDLTDNPAQQQQQQRPPLESYVTVSAEIPCPERQQYGTDIHTNSGWAFSAPDNIMPSSAAGSSSPSSSTSHHHPGLTPYSGSFSPRSTTSNSNGSAGGFLGGLAEPWHAPNSRRSESSSPGSFFGGRSSAMPMRGDEGYLPPPPPSSMPFQQHQQQPQSSMSSSSNSYWELEGLSDIPDAWQ